MLTQLLMSFRKWGSVTSTGSTRTGNNKVFEEKYYQLCKAVWQLKEENKILKNIIYKEETCMRYSGMCDYCPFMRYDYDAQEWYCNNDEELNQLRKSVDL